MRRIVAVCPKEFPGVSSVFRHGEREGLWEFVQLGNRIPLDTTLLIVGGWCKAYFEMLGNPSLPVIVFITSTIAQMEFSWNQIELLQMREIGLMLEQNLLKAVFAGWSDVIDFGFSKTKEMGKAFHFPYPLAYRYARKIITKKKLPNSIGFFAPMSPRKNCQNQILAATSSGELHTNLKISGGKIKYYEWPTEPEYLDILARLKVTLHCGFTESFCYAAAESILMGTVPIISFQIAQNLGISEDAPIIVRQLDSINNIKRKIANILEWSDSYYAEYATYLQSLIAKTSKQNYDKDKIILDKLAG